VFEVSNRFEIQQELADAQNDLQHICREEAKMANRQEINTVTIEPKYGREMTALREKCSQLRMILDAMEASED
jgi:hypothetical protein